MSSAPSESHPITLSIALNIGRDTKPLRSYTLEGPDAFAKAGVIDQIVRHVLSEWPRHVYTDQLKKLARERCSQKE